jgi:ADP-heptose:LPS heptosyltransferase
MTKLHLTKQRKVILKNFQSPGDILMITAAVRDLKLSYPDILIDVRTSVKEIWENNPYLTKLDEKDKDVEVFKVEYPLIHFSNEGQYHFIHGYRKNFEEQLGLKIEPKKTVQGEHGKKKWEIPCSLFKGDIHISDEEKSWMSQIEERGIKKDFWIIMAGGKYDFTAKWWNPDYYQEVVNHFKGKVTFVQCGEKSHWHPKLKGVVNLIGKTDFRQFIRLIYHSVGVLCPVTFAMHAAAAIESKHGLKNRPCVVISGGREPSQWEKYPHHRFLETNGALDCCDNGGCWKSRCQTVGDGDEKDTQGLCIYPIKIPNRKLSIPKCMDMIKPKDVIRSIEMYYDGGILKYESLKNNE